MNNIILPASGLALVLYAVAFALLWRHLNTRLHQTGDNISGAPPSVSGIAFVAAALGLICQFLATVSALIQNEPVMSLNLSLLAVSSLVTCVIVGVTAISTLRVRADNLMLLCLPLAAISLGALSLIPAGNTQPIALDSAQIGHILLSISAYAALMTAALQSVLIALQERRLRTPQTGLIGLLPPMESMENLFITMLWLGVGLLTLSIVTALGETLNEPVTILSYQEVAIGTGSDAQAICIVSIEDREEGQRCYGIGLSRNTTTTAFNAVISAMNRRWSNS